MKLWKSKSFTARHLPHELFDGNSVLWEARRLFPGRTITGENVSDVLDAVVSLIRKRAPRSETRQG